MFGAVANRPAGLCLANVNQDNRYQHTGHMLHSIKTVRAILHQRTEVIAIVRKNFIALRSNKI